MSHLALILDTNYFLHFQDPESIAWLDLFQDHTKISLLVVPPVVEEIDHKKWSGKTNKEKNRAKDVTAKFKMWFHEDKDPSLQKGVSIERIKKASLDGGKDLDPAIPDDAILLYALRLQPSFDRIIILTHDFGLQDRARDYNIDYFELSDKFQRAVELDPTEKELVEARKELQKFKNRSPKLELFFTDSKKHQEYSLKYMPLFSEKERERRLVIAKEKYPLHKFESEISFSKKSKSENGLTQFVETLGAFQQLTSQPTAQDWAEYNQQLEEFYNDCEQYILEKNIYEELVSRTIEIDLVLVNDGTAPASEININLYFPVSVSTTLVYADDFMEAPQLSQAPEKPKGLAHRLALFGQSPLYNGDMFIPSFNSNKDFGRDNVSDPDIRKTRSFDVSFKVDTLQHHLQQNIKRLCLTFPSIEEAKSFQIQWTVNSNEQIEPRKGTLDVIIKA